MEFPVTAAFQEPDVGGILLCGLGFCGEDRHLTPMPSQRIAESAIGFIGPNMKFIQRFRVSMLPLSFSGGCDFSRARCWKHLMVWSYAYSNAYSRNYIVSYWLVR